MSANRMHHSDTEKRPLRVLIVHSGNATKGQSAAYTFVHDQGEALTHIGVEVDYYAVVGRGVRGYLRALGALRAKIGEVRPDIIHAHYGLCGLLCGLQRQIPVVTTFHGSDINSPRILKLSKVAMRLSKWNIFVSRSSIEKAHITKHYSLLPCGVDLTDEQLTDKAEARRAMGIDEQAVVVLFAGAFANSVKDSPLAKEAMQIVRKNRPNAQLMELKGYTRKQVNLLMCAADAFLMTSKTEGSPQVIKEAMACGCPIVSVNVGDVAERIGNADGGYIASSRSADEIAALVEKALAYRGRTAMRQKILAEGLDNNSIAHKLLTIYRTIVE